VSPRRPRAPPTANVRAISKQPISWSSLTLASRDSQVRWAQCLHDRTDRVADGASKPPPQGDAQVSRSVGPTFTPSARHESDLSMTSTNPREPGARKGRMNRSRMIAAGTSVGALVAITAGVAVANPAPSGASTKARPLARQAPSTPAPQTPAPTAPSFGSDDQGSTGWQQLPPDTTPAPTSPAITPTPDQTPTFDPNAGADLGGSNTRSGGS